MEDLLGDDDFFLQRINWYREICEQIRACFNQNGNAIGADGERARLLLRALKDRLIEDYKIGHNSRLSNDMSNSAKKYYRTVMEAKTRLKVTTGSRPDSKWGSDIYSFLIDINYHYPKAKKNV